MKLNIDVTIENIDLDAFPIVDLDTVDDYFKFIVGHEESDSLREKEGYASILFTNNETIRTINKEYRSNDKATDVITFAYLDGLEEEEVLLEPIVNLGDIIISLEQIDLQAKEFNHSFKREFFYILTHGILHMLGYSHDTPCNKKVMRAKEEELLKAFKLYEV